jgi:hypothetical protein
VAAILLVRLSPWKRGAVPLGMLAGAGVPFLVVAAPQWENWHNRVAGDNTPNPYYRGGFRLAWPLPESRRSRSAFDAAVRSQCGGWESNPQAPEGHRILSPARRPVPPPPRARIVLTV